MLIVVAATYWSVHNLEDKIKLIVLVIGVLLISMIVPENSVTTMISSIFNDLLADGGNSSVGGSSLEMRLEQLSASFTLFMESPIWGHGLAVTRIMSESGVLPQEIRAAESLLFSQMIDAGMVGIMAHIYFYFFIFRFFLHPKQRMDTNLRKLTLLAASMVIGYVLYILSTGDINTFQFFIILITLIARYISLNTLNEYK